MTFTVEQARAQYNRVIQEAEGWAKAETNAIFTQISKEIESKMAKSLVINKELSTKVVSLLEDAGFTVQRSTHRNEVSYTISGWDE